MSEQSIVQTSERFVIDSSSFYSSSGDRTFGDVEGIPSGQVDLVLDRCLCHLVPPNDARYLAQLAGKLAAGSRVIVREVNLDSLLRQWPTSATDDARLDASFFDQIYGSHGPREHVRKNIYRPTQLLALFESAGFTETQLVSSELPPLPAAEESCLQLYTFERSDHLDANIPVVQREPSPPTAKRSLLKKIDSAVRFGLRTGICTALRPIPNRMRRANLGCGRYPLPGYINVDTRAMPWIDRQGSLFSYLREVSASSLDSIHLAHVLEHLTYDEVGEFLELATFALRPGGLLEVAVPNMDAVMRMQKDDALADELKQLVVQSTLWGGRGYHDNYHMYAYSPESLSARLKAYNFEGITQVSAFSRWPFWDSAELTKVAGHDISLNLLARNMSKHHV